MASISLRSAGTSPGSTVLNTPLTIAQVDSNFDNINAQLVTATYKAFANFAVSGQTTVAAGVAQDTITLAGTNGISISTSGSTITLTTNASTTAVSTIVLRDSSGNFTAGTITASLSGNATTATSATSATNSTNINSTTDASSTTAKNFIPFAISGTGFISLKSSTNFQYDPFNKIFYVPTISIANASISAAASFLGNSTGTISVAAAQTIGSTSYTLVLPGKNDTLATLSDVSAAAGTIGTGTLTVTATGSGISGSGTFGANQNTNTTITLTSNATNANTASTIVFRDASGNFSASTITAALSGNATTATTATNQSGGTIAATTGSFSGTLTGVGANFSGTVSATFSGNGASITSLTAGNLGGTIPSGVLGNSTVYIGTTAIALNRATASQTLTGISIDGNAVTATTATNQSGGTISATTGSFSGTLTGVAANFSSAITATNATLSGRILLGNGSATSPALSFSSDSSTDSGFYWISNGIIGVSNNGTLISQFTGSGISVSGTVAATTLTGAGSAITSLTAGNLGGTIPSGVLGNSTVYIGTTSILLNRASATQTLTGISIDGNAATSTSVSGGSVSATTGSFSGTLTGVAANFSGTVSATFSGNGSSITSLTAGNLGGTIPSGVLGNSTVYLGTTALPLNSASGAVSSFAISITGNASTATTATNQSGGTVSATTGSFSGTLTGVAANFSGTVSATFSGNGSSITSLTSGNLTGTIPSGVLGNSTVYIGTTAIALNRASSSISLTGVNIDGSANSASITTTQPYTDASTKIASTQFVMNALGNFSSVQAPFSGTLTLAMLGDTIQVSGNITLPVGNTVQTGSAYWLYNQTANSYTVTVGNTSTDFIYNPASGFSNTNRFITLGPGDSAYLVNRSSEWDIFGGSLADAASAANVAAIKTISPRTPDYLLLMAGII